MLYTRPFAPVTGGHGSPAAGQPLVSMPDRFFEAIPVKAGATSIVVIDPFQTMIGQLELSGAAPVVDTITLPPSFEGVQTVSWSVTDPDSTEHFFQVDYSPDGGQTWQHQAQGLKQTSLTLDFGTSGGIGRPGRVPSDRLGRHQLRRGNERTVQRRR